jgi:hypothetical protein
MIRLRGSTVEPVLGTLINFLAMKRVNTRGIEQADKCATMASSAYNLKKLLKFMKSRPKTTIKMIEVAKSVQKSFFSVQYYIHWAIGKIAARQFLSSQPSSVKRFY